MEQDFNRILSRTWLNIVIKCLNAESIFELKFQKFELSLHFFRDIPSMMYVTSSDFSSLLYVNIPDFSSLRHFLFFRLMSCSSAQSVSLFKIYFDLFQEREIQRTVIRRVRLSQSSMVILELQLASQM